MSATAVRLNVLATRLGEADAILCRDAADLIEKLFESLDRAEAEIEKLRHEVNRSAYHGD